MKAFAVAALLAVSCGGSSSSAAPQEPVAPKAEASKTEAPAPEAKAAVATPPSGEAAAREADAPTSHAPLAIAKLGEYRDAICKCADKACANRMLEEMTQWAQQMAKQHPNEPHMTEAEIQRAKEISDALVKCMTAVMNKP
jgi:hypothetical protein